MIVNLSNNKFKNNNKSIDPLNQIQNFLIMSIVETPEKDVFVFVFNSGHRNQVTCPLLGGFSKPRAEVIQLLDYGLCSI